MKTFNIVKNRLSGVVFGCSSQLFTSLKEDDILLSRCLVGTNSTVSCDSTVTYEYVILREKPLKQTNNLDSSGCILIYLVSHTKLKFICTWPAFLVAFDFNKISLHGPWKWILFNSTVITNSSLLNFFFVIFYNEVTFPFVMLRNRVWKKNEVKI